MNPKLLYLLLFSFALRLALAFGIELGNDEVYYRIFALFPDWSYFDHPPLVAWLIRLTTLGSEVAPDGLVRLGAVVIGTINTYLVYRIVLRIARDQKAALLGALLYTASIYGFIISGTFIMPDTPLVLFWLLAIDRLWGILPCGKIGKSERRSMLLVGVFVGMAMLSKYTGAYLWGAAGLYILLFNRKWLVDWSLWAGGVLSLVVFAPVIYWNVQNDFVTFTFHGARVTAESSINPLFFGRELAGGLLYNNPVVWFVAVLALFAWRKRRFVSKEIYRLAVVFSLPMIALFLFVSLTRETLPHWAAPAYLALIVLGAVYLSQKKRAMMLAVMACALTFGVSVFGFVQIRYGVMDLDSREGVVDMGRRDFSLDTYGWKQGGELFAQYVAADTLMPKNGVTIIHNKWYDAAHLDAYFALPQGFELQTLGDTISTHYWEWINARRGGLTLGDSLYFISTSRKVIDPHEYYRGRFDSITPADTLKIYRCGRHEYNFYVYRMLGLKKECAL